MKLRITKDLIEDIKFDNTVIEVWWGSNSESCKNRFGSKLIYTIIDHTNTKFMFVPDVITTESFNYCIKENPWSDFTKYMNDYMDLKIIRLNKLYFLKYIDDFSKNLYNLLKERKREKPN